MPPFTGVDVQLAGIAPELTLCIAAFVVLLVDAFYGDVGGRLHLPLLATIGVLIAGALAWGQWDTNELQLGGMVAVDGFAAFVKVALAGFALLTIWVGRDALSRSNLDDGEFYGLILFVLAGMMLMAGAADLIVVFLALETFSIGLYVLVGFRVHSLSSQESALKYFLLGAFSSAFFLLGIALTYGATGTTNLYGVRGPDATEGIVTFLTSTPAENLGFLALAAGLLMVGLGFKIAAVPFHMWTPDAYQGAPSPITGFMAAATKLAAFAVLIRLFDAILYPLREDWRPLVIGIAVATMVAGSVIAVVQEDLKRLLAYSSIAHAGFLLVGVTAASDEGVAASLFYLVTYGLTTLGAFAVVTALGGRDEERVRLNDFRGLFYERPVLAGALTLFLLSLAGVPITAGFVAKLLVFGAAVQAGFWWLVVIGVLASAVATFFYLRVMVVMYMQEREGAAVEMAPSAGIPSYAVIGLAAAATVWFGLLWGPLSELTQQATFFFESAT
ncbi:MAG: NADH-quinone oxidoreductase subunit N [Actinomycetota bacterium]|nr:NADH-quinone oxidoreductase subunit N [Actinomycetota bacterium]